MNEALLGFRKRNALTQAEAAEVVGMSEIGWRQQESGRRGPAPRWLLMHLAALDLLAKGRLPWPTRGDIDGDDDEQGPR